MKPQRTIAPIVALLLMAGCAAVDIGQDPILVNAERTITGARGTFQLLTKTEYDVYPALKATNPAVAAEVRTFVNKVRSNQQQWLQTATNLKDAYKAAPTGNNQDAMDKAIAVLTSAVAEATKYIAIMTQTHAWLSYQLADHIGERK